MTSHSFIFGLGPVLSILVVLLWESSANENEPVDDKTLKEAFDVFDQNHDQKIDIEDLRKTFEALGDPQSPANLKTMITLYDTNGDDMIDLEEFRAMYNASLTKDENYIILFDKYKNKEGLLSREGFNRLVQEVVGIEGTNNKVNSVFDEVDTDNDGQISREEFVNLLKKNSKAPEGKSTDPQQGH